MKLNSLLHDQIDLNQESQLIWVRIKIKTFHQMQDLNNGNDIITDISDQTVNPNVGDHIELKFPLCIQYYPGVLKNIDKSGQHAISYADVDEAQFFKKDETWRFINNNFNSSQHTLL